MAKIKYTPDLLPKLRRQGITFFPAPRPGGTLLNIQTSVECNTQHPKQGFLPLGMFSYSRSFFFAASVGRYCSIADNVKVMGASHPLDWATTSTLAYNRKRRENLGVKCENVPVFGQVAENITIGHDVWIGQDVTMKRGISIGNGAVIAAGSVVTKDVAANTIVGGNPAREIRKRLDPAIFEKLNDLRWWDKDPDIVMNLSINKPEKFAVELEDLALPDFSVDSFKVSNLIC